jgi:hypothetical protein
MALFMALLASAILMGLGLSLALLGTGETTLAGRARDGTSAAYAARAAAALAIAELRAQPSWAGVLMQGAYPELSAAPARVVDTSLTPLAPWGAPLDLRALTTALQAETDAAGGAGDPIAWRLFAYCPIGRLAPAGAWTRYYLVAWVSDDRADGDGNPSADMNGSILVHAEALGADGGRTVLEATVQRTASAGGGADQVRLVTIRPKP